MWWAYVRMCKNELSKGIIQSETVDIPSLHREHQLCRGTIHREARSNELSSGLANILWLSLAVFVETVDTKDGAN